jgi:site-specific DNA-cytosine methylase
MSKPKFVDCQGLAGAWSLGTVQAGMELTHRVSLPGGFGDEVAGLNRPLLGNRWSQEVGQQEEWTPQVTDYLCGTPPCSGFSLLNTSKKKNARGVNSTINTCMKELIAYAGRCEGSDAIAGPQIVAFESVQGAYTEGRPLMLALREMLELATKQKYTLTHVKMAGASVGAAQFRRRYYPVFHRIPFGIDEPTLDLLPDGHIVTYFDAIGDLAGSKIQWEAQRYRKKPKSEFAASRRREDGKFTDHVPVDFKRKSPAIEEALAAGWPRGMGLNTACVELGIRPPSIEKAFDEEKGKYRGFSWPRRIRPDRCGYVLTGAAGSSVHWEESRSLTVREISRLMGYPDAWLWPTANHKVAAAWVGKCCPVDSGRWISKQVRCAIEGSHIGSAQELIGDREYLHDSTNAYKDYPGADVPPVEREPA